MKMPINQHKMMKLPKGVKFRKGVANQMDELFEPSDLFIHLSWLPVEYPTKSHVLIPFLVALFADRVKDLIKDITADIQSNQDSEIKPKFIVFFEYGHDKFMHAYVLYELCVPDKNLYHVDLDWYSNKWYMNNYLFCTDYRCIGNITNTSHLLTDVIGLSNTKKKFYVTENLTNPRVNTNFINSGFVIDTYSDCYEKYAPYINAW